MRTVVLLVTLAAVGFVPASVAGPRLTAPSATAAGARTGAAPVAPTFALPVAPAFALPVAPPAVMLTPFRPPEHPYGSGHRGVDLAADVGSTVRAAGSGSVVYAGVLAGRGVVSVQHLGGLRTTYEPVDPSVTAGQHVEKGEVIGTLEAGHPACAPASCLHWGARLSDGSYLDPMSLLRPWQVRLKPWDG